MSNGIIASKSKSIRLQVVPTKPPPEPRLGGFVPDSEMNPGIYSANCESAWLDEITKGTRAIFQFCVIGPEHEGTALRMWVQVSDAGGFVSPIGRYAKYCEIALGRPLTRSDRIADPASIFSSRNFSILCGYSKTQQRKGGAFSDKNTLIKKYPGDYLRVHDILGLVSL
jgi:hypothetical protein